MLTSAELVKEISKSIGKLKVVALGSIIKQQQFYISDLVDITFHSNKKVAFRAAWILENMLLQKPEDYADNIEYIFSQIKNIENPGCKRHYAKIVMHLTSPKAPAIIQHKLASVDPEPIVEKMFDWLIDPKVLIAVKVFTAQSLFNMRHRYPWIADELANQLRFLMLNGTAAIQSRGRKLLEQLGQG